ncbi:origin recognition complex subunit 3 N-terminus-domain-containing protein [Piptocephalis cylindrospora]|uniref:Origin recognition complex subunit 3 N-terminus-domain-containing protein n=1 Tax=Piptocephalis cylindrospora TaxID=1907219 RepID=A0A4V1IXV8_9FUNG|nr:origin recognition complex subunit 3 N-terminus-domain-containing protein [Piptocephalis cylindrospora]|eukprot:RKP12409.1 origin recognition complex subunit 3 N-terminus-domain-containing protein [Piptocephalis cylindrospora]
MPREARSSDKDACLSVHWPGKGGKGQKGKSRGQPSLEGRAMYRGFRRLLDEEEPVYLLERRRRLLETMWKRMEGRMLQVVEEQDKESIEQVVRFVRSTHPPSKKTEMDNQSIKEIWHPSPSSQLPLGLIHTGVNTPDHARRFSTITSALNQDNRAKVVTIYPRDGAHLRTILQRIVEGFTDPGREVQGGENFATSAGGPHKIPEEEDGDEEEDATYTLFSPTDQTTRKMSRLAPYDLRTLQAWYHSPARHPHTRHLVIVLREFEGFPSGVLEDLVMILSEYASRLPLVLLAAAATSFSALSRALSRAALGLLRVAWLQLESSAKGIFDAFIASDRSVRTFAQSFKLAMMDFYYANPLSILTDPEMASDGNRIITLLGEAHEEWIRSLGSFQAHVDGLVKTGLAEDLNRARQLVQGEGMELKNAIQEWMEAHRNKQCFYSLGMSIAIQLMGVLEKEDLHSPTKSSKDTLRETKGETFLGGGAWEECRASCLHAHYLNGTLLTKEDSSGGPRRGREGILDRILSRVRELPSTALSTFLDAVLDSLRSSNTLPGLWGESVVRIMDGMDRCKGKIDALHDDLRNLEIESSEAIDNPSSLPKKRGRKRKAEANVEIHVANGTRVLHSLEMESSRDTKGSRRDKSLEFPEGTPLEVKTYSLLVAEVRTSLEEFFSLAFTSYRDLPLHEVAYHENPSLITKSFHPHPRLAIQTALGRPWHYLSYDGTHSETVLDHTLPDTSILYRLHLECGAYINLQDWCEAFHAIARRDGEKHTEEELA